jgi:hypothetical protein
MTAASVLADNNFANCNLPLARHRSVTTGGKEHWEASWWLGSMAPNSLLLTLVVASRVSDIRPTDDPSLRLRTVTAR